MFLDYLTERYDASDFPISFEEAEKIFLKGRKVHQSEKGFLSYEMKGDAVIIYDIFIRPECRHQSEAQTLGGEVLAIAQKEGKRLAIGFSEKVGKNHLAGLKAMKRAGFVPAHKTNDEFVFWKGI